MLIEYFVVGLHTVTLKYTNMFELWDEKRRLIERLVAEGIGPLSENSIPIFYLQFLYEIHFFFTVLLFPVEQG